MLVLVVDKFASLALAMMFPPSNPVRALPANAAAWARVAPATRESHYTAWGDDVLVDVHASKLVTALPNMQYVTISGQQHLPLNVIVYLLGRLGWVEDYRLQVDLASGLSAATLASFEEWAVTDGRLDWTPTSETAFLQRVLSLAAELRAAGALPAALKVTADSFVPFEGHDDSAGGPDWSDSWQSRVKVSSLTQGGMLGPYADIISPPRADAARGRAHGPRGSPDARRRHARRLVDLRLALGPLGRAPAAAAARVCGVQEARSANRALRLRHRFPRHVA